MIAIVAISIALTGHAGAHPKTDTAEPHTVPAAESWRSKRPTAGAFVAAVPPEFQVASLPSGLQIYVVSQPTLPIIQVSWVTRGGATLDPPERAGLSSMVAAMLEDGTETLDELQFSDHLADLGAHFSAAAGRNYARISIAGLKRESDAMLAVLRDVLTRPRFAPEAFERRKKKRLSSLADAKRSISGLASLHFPGLVYGPEHPYARPVHGTEASVRRIEADALRGHHSALFHPSRSALILAGDISLAEGKEWAARFLDHNGGAAPAAAAIPLVEASPRRHIVVIDRPGSPQTYMLLGRPSIALGHPEEQALKLANGVFGGDFSARINMVLREEKGYTYGAYSQAILRDGVGAITIYAKIRTDDTVKAVTTTLAELRRMTTAPPSDEEVRLVREGLIRGLTSRFQSISSLGGSAEALFLERRPLDHYRTLATRVRGVSEDAIATAARAYFAPDLMRILLVGDRARITEQLTAENIPFQVRTADPEADTSSAG